MKNIKFKRKYGERCYLCSKPLNGDVTRDHMYPKSRYEEFHIERKSQLWNCRNAHTVCNKKKGNMTLVEFKNSYEI